MAQSVSVSASMLIVRFGVRILLEIRKVFRLDNSILNKIEVPLTCAISWGLFNAHIGIESDLIENNDFVKKI